MPANRADVAVKMLKFGKPIIGEPEQEAVLRALVSDKLTNGEYVMAFEDSFREMVGGGLTTAVSSCFAALHISCVALGVQEGDEVIVPALTHPATAHAVVLAGGKPVFVDVEHDGNISPAAINAALTPLTKAICVVHFLGKPARMREIIAIARKHDLTIIEDCALALGARLDGKHVGLHGDVGCFSFYPVKHITTGEGGMLLTHNLPLQHAARRLREFGKEPVHQTIVWFGFNYRMSEMQGALGWAQLKRLPWFLACRAANWKLLRQRLPEFEVVDSSGGSYFGFSVMVPEELNRNSVCAAMKSSGIETSIYYNPVVPLVPYYRDKYGFRRGQFPIAEDIAERSICLPVGPHLGHEHMQRIARCFRAATRSREKTSLS